MSQVFKFWFSGAGQMPNAAVSGGGGVQGGRAEHRAQRGDLPRGAQQDGGLRPTHVQRLRHRPDGDGHLPGLLQVTCVHTLAASRRAEVFEITIAWFFQVRQHPRRQTLVCEALPAVPRDRLREAEGVPLLAGQGGQQQGEQRWTGGILLVREVNES